MKEPSFDVVYDFANLYAAYRAARKGKRWKNSVAKVESNALEAVARLQVELQEGFYRPGDYHEFFVFEPKRRLIQTNSIKDKIVQHAFCDQILYPVLSRPFILDNYGSQIGKGTHFGLNRLADFMREYYRKNGGADGWVLKADVHHYFASIRHDVLKQDVAKRLSDPRSLSLAYAIIDSTPGEVGIPIGNQSSQIFALLYLNELDHFVKEGLRIRYYGRYIRQWLNKSGTGWFTAQTSYDQAPSNANVWSNYNEYDAEPGFLTGFGAEMLAALLTTSLTVAKPSVDGGGSETFNDKVFLLSMAEVGLGSENGIAEGSLLALFNSNNSSRLCMPTSQAVSKSEYTNSSLSASQNWWWWLRSPDSAYADDARVVISDGSLNNDRAYYGDRGVRPALNLNSNILVSDTTDSEGYYTIVWNNAPTTPPSITVPDGVRSGKNVSVSWAASVDSDGDAVSYELERQANSGTWTKIYDGAATQYADAGVTASMNTVCYRVRAKDSRGAYSGYTTGPARTVVHNADPTVSGSNQALGTVTTPPSYTYSVGDTDTGDTLTIVESLDGAEVRTINNAVRGQNYTFALSAAQFAALAGAHTMAIKVTDSAGNSATRTITFSRAVSIIDFDWKMDETSAAAEKVLISMRYNAHENGVTIQVCNNFNDASPTWETAKIGLKHIFSNAVKTAATWAVGVRVQINKTGGYDSIACYALSGSYI